MTKGEREEATFSKRERERAPSAIEGGEREREREEDIMAINDFLDFGVWLIIEG